MSGFAWCVVAALWLAFGCFVAHEVALRFPSEPSFRRGYAFGMLAWFWPGAIALAIVARRAAPTGEEDTK